MENKPVQRVDLIIAVILVNSAILCGAMMICDTLRHLMVSVR